MCCLTNSVFYNIYTIFFLMFTDATYLAPFNKDVCKG